MAQITDGNFSSFVRTLASVLEGIEARQAANAQAERDARAAEQVLPAVAHAQRTPLVRVEHHRKAA